MDDKDLRIILLGKTGSGKSSLGNTILGKTEFKVENSPNSVTKTCSSNKIQRNGKTISLFDTPGVFDTDPNSSHLSEEFYNCVKDCGPGPHAFLLVLKVERFTQQEEEAVKEILKYFSEEVLKYTTVVFTHGDGLDEGQKINDWAKQNEALRSLVQRCGGRCHVFDNKYWKNNQDLNRNNQDQVTALLRTIEETVEKNGGRCYTNSFWQHLKYMKIKGVPIKYLLMALLGTVGGVGAACVAKCLFDATVDSTVLAGVVGAGVGGAVGAGVVYAPEVGAAASSAVGAVGKATSGAVGAVGAAASSAVGAVGKATSGAVGAAGNKASDAVKNIRVCFSTGNKPKTS